MTCQIFPDQVQAAWGKCCKVQLLPRRGPIPCHLLLSNRNEVNLSGNVAKELDVFATPEFAHPDLSVLSYSVALADISDWFQQRIIRGPVRPLRPTHPRWPTPKTDSSEGPYGGVIPASDKGGLKWMLEEEGMAEVGGEQEVKVGGDAGRFERHDGDRWEGCRSIQATRDADGVTEKQGGTQEDDHKPQGGRRQWMPRKEREKAAGKQEGAPDGMGVKDILGAEALQQKEHEGRGPKPGMLREGKDDRQGEREGGAHQRRKRSVKTKRGEKGGGMK
ncbi:hypothetical protein B0H10DRAFT_2194477 [Mycena sp. CBHHK59/15]|nr:hypothetical protein B0H10DRAFT_2194477 [Mycena sp. CBHHK59/15]